MMNINALRPLDGVGKKLFVETYGCQMNVGDTEIVISILQQEGYRYTERIEEADGPRCAARRCRAPSRC